MIAIFRFSSRDTNQEVGYISCHDSTADCEQLKRAGYSPVFFLHQTAMNWVDTQGEFEQLAARHQEDFEYVVGGGIALPIQRDKQGNATFGGLRVKEGETDAEREENSGGFL